jgi:hypothetical protein
MNREELEDQLEHWLNVNYRMDNEGFEYCFKHYSSFSEIKDEEFHNLRLSMLSQMGNMRKLVSDKIGIIQNTIEELEDE